MNDWREFEDRADVWRRAGDVERLGLIDLYWEAQRYRENDPEHQFALLTKGSNEARRLNEPWWILFFDSWRLSTLTADMHNFARALPLAMELMVLFARPENCYHPCAIGIQIHVIYTYLQVDPFGHRDEIERGFASLDQRISREPVSDRFIFNYRWIEYLIETRCWQKAYDFAQEHQALVARGGSEAWWLCWSLFLLCQICDELGLVDELAGYAEEMTERSESHSQLKRTRATGWIWRAVVHRTRGEEKAASRDFHTGMRLLKSLSSHHEICGDALAKYYELGGDTKAVLGIRDRELSAIVKKGLNHRSAILQIERCKLLNRMKTLTPDDLNDARKAAAKMKLPDWYLQRIADL